MCADKAPDANGKNGSHKSFSTCPLYETLPEFKNYHKLCATANRELRSLLGKLCLSIDAPCITISMSSYAKSTEVAALPQIGGINFGPGSYITPLSNGAAPSAIRGLTAEIVTEHFATGKPMVRYGVGDRLAGEGKGHTGTQRQLFFATSLAQLAQSVLEKPDRVSKACAMFAEAMKEEQQKLATVRASAPFAQPSLCSVILISPIPSPTKLPHTGFELEDTRAAHGCARRVRGEPHAARREGVPHRPLPAQGGAGGGGGCAGAGFREEAGQGPGQGGQEAQEEKWVSGCASGAREGQSQSRRCIGGFTL